MIDLQQERLPTKVRLQVLCSTDNSKTLLYEQSPALTAAASYSNTIGRSPNSFLSLRRTQPKLHSELCVLRVNGF